MMKRPLLYTKLAKIYDEIYPKIFNYKKMAKDIHNILKKHKVKKILEVACGTGRLAKYLHDFGYDIIGTDYSEEMLFLARKNAPGVKFIKQDMRKLTLKQKFDAVICMGRSFSYMVTNQDVDKALKSFNKVLRKKGILIFDNFNAERSIRYFEKKYKKRTEVIKLKNKTVIRNHKQSWNLSTGITWNWTCEYIIKQDNKIERIKDTSILRGFLRSELEYFLEKNGFKILKVYPRNFLIVAYKL